MDDIERIGGINMEEYLNDETSMKDVSNGFP